MKPLVLAGAMMLFVAPAAAQANNQPGNQQPPAAPCQADPGPNGNADTSNGNGSDKQKPPSGDLTRKLGPCNGVLKPPPTGDTDLTAPAPDQGNTPVIRPGQLPPQPQKK
jgi:hypothetical protein